MYRVKAIKKYIGSCMMFDIDKVFITRFFAKLYYSRLCKSYDLVFIEERFGEKWIKLSSKVKYHGE